MYESKNPLRPVMILLFLFVSIAGVGAQDVQFDRKPLDAFADQLKSLIEAKQVSFEDKFRVRMVARFTPKGRFDPKSIRWILEEGENPKAVELAKRALLAIDESGFSVYLGDLDVQEVDMELVQDGEWFRWKLSLSQSTRERARSFAISLRSFISVIEMVEARERRFLGDDGKAILRALKVDSEANIVRLRFEMSNDDLYPMVERNILFIDRENSDK